MEIPLTCCKLQHYILAAMYRSFVSSEYSNIKKDIKRVFEKPG